MGDDEEIDLGKLWRKFFKKKEHSELKTEPHKTTEEHAHHDIVHTTSEQSELAELDIQKHLRWIIPTLIILSIFIFAFYIRAQTVNLPALERSAENTVHNFYRSQISAQIDQQYPNLPQQNKDVLIAKDFQKFAKDNSKLLSGQIASASEQYKAQFRDQDGQTYLLGIDPYYYYRQTRNLLEFGTVGTEVRDGKPFDSYKPAPEGSFVDSNLHPYFSVAVYGVMRIFSDISLMGAFFYVGALVAALSVIPAFFIGRKVGGNVGGFFSALFISINLFFVSRTAGESSDTDAYVVLLPLLVSWVFLEALDAKSLRNKILFGILAGALVGLYAFAWSGWWFIFYFILAALLVAIVHSVVSDSWKKGSFTYDPVLLKSRLSLFVAIVLSSGLFVALFRDVATFTAVLRRPFQFLELKAVATTKIWPNVLTTVAELNPASFDYVINNLGGEFLLVLAIVGITLTLVRKEFRWNEFFTLLFLGLGLALGFLYWSGAAPFTILLLLALLSLAISGTLIYFTSSLSGIISKMDLTYFFLFGIWLGAALWSTKSGVRFTLIIVPALALGAGFFCGILYRYLLAFFSEGLHIDRRISGAVLFGLLAILLIFPQNQIAMAYQQGINSVPSFNDGWYSALTSIKENSSSNAIITSWWDFGHWFKAIADRPVTFDGGSQNRPQAHWVGKLLLTPDEKVAFGILRMLDCGGNWAFDEVDKVINDIPRSVNLVNDIIVKDRDAAAAILKNHGFTSEQAAGVIRYTHCTPPEAYVIASDDMIGKAGVWGHFGAWDFNRAAMAFETRALGREDALSRLQDKFNLSFDEAQQVYTEIITKDLNQWIAPWPGYLSGFNDCRSDNTSLLCIISSSQGEFPLIVDKATLNATIPSQDGNAPIHPRSIVFIRDGKVEERAFTPSIGLSVMLVPNGDSARAVLADALQAKSMFSQMYYYRGIGLKCFIPFEQQRQITGGMIYVYKVDWECEI